MLWIVFPSVFFTATMRAPCQAHLQTFRSTAVQSVLGMRAQPGGSQTLAVQSSTNSSSNWAIKRTPFLWTLSLTQAALKAPNFCSPSTASEAPVEASLAALRRPASPIIVFLGPQQRQTPPETALPPAAASCLPMGRSQKRLISSLHGQLPSRGGLATLLALTLLLAPGPGSGAALLAAAAPQHHRKEARFSGAARQLLQSCSTECPAQSECTRLRAAVRTPPAAPGPPPSCSCRASFQAADFS